MNIKTKNLFFILGILLFIAGCSDNSDKKNEKEKNKAASKEVIASKIEVVKNENAHIIKVQSKAKDKNQSKSYYYDYNQDKKSPKKEERVRTVIDANLHIRSPYDKVRVSMLVKKLSKDFIVRCSACHNDYANGIIGPSLLGKDSDFIYKAILEFKSGKKENVLMTDLIKKMSDKHIKKLAIEIDDFNKQVQALNK